MNDLRNENRKNFKNFMNRHQKESKNEIILYKYTKIKHFKNVLKVWTIQTPIFIVEEGDPNYKLY